MNLDNFDWGQIKSNSKFLDIVNQEIFVDNVYEKFFKVKENDIVVDIGASVGPFSYSILGRNPKHIFCLEPHEDLFVTLKNNLKKSNVTCINAGLALLDGETPFRGLYNKDSMDMWSKTTVSKSITFDTFIKNYNIEKIDFLKIDCEGGEYALFKEENFDWILKNIKKLSGEWHLHNLELKQEFRNFRDKFLSKIPNEQISVLSMDNIDIKHDLWTDWFIEYYACIMIYINFEQKI